MRAPSSSILSVPGGRVRDGDHETTSMTLSVRQKKHLRRLGHDLKPVVMTGAAGVSPALLAELDGALEHHELVKVRVRTGDRAARDGMISELCEETRAELVQRIGHIALLYRPRPEDPAITLPG
jgi:RNA-binding protein